MKAKKMAAMLSLVGAVALMSGAAATAHESGDCAAGRVTDSQQWNYRASAVMSGLPSLCQDGDQHPAPAHDAYDDADARAQNTVDALHWYR